MNSKVHPARIKLPTSRVWLAAVCIFLVAFGVRLLMLHDSQVDAAAQSGRSEVYLGPLEIYELGPASFLWTRYPRVVVATIQHCSSQPGCCHWL